MQPFVGLSVRENILVGAHLHHRARDAALAVADQVGHDVGLGDLLDRPADTLTVAGRKRLELARALATEPKLLLLDEVLAGLNPSEIRDIVPVIRDLCRRGITILMIEHVMQAVMSLAEHVFVLAEGRIIAAGSAGANRCRSRRRRGLSRPWRRGKAGGVAWTVAPCSPSATFTPATARPRCCAASIWRWMRGEIVAVLGSNGAGKSTLNRAISGVLRARKGSIRFAGHMIERGKAGKHRLARTHSRAGRPPRLSQSERTATISISAAIGARAISGGRIASAYSAFSRVLPSDSTQRAGTLSGGEQQMLAIGRGLMAEPNSAYSRRAFARVFHRSWSRSSLP